MCIRDSPGREAAEKSGFNMARIISSESFPVCPLQISLPFLTAKAWGMPLTPIGAVSYTHLDVYKRQSQYIAALTPATYQRGGLPRTCRENSSWEGLGA